MTDMRPSENDMITKPRRDARDASLAELASENERLREGLADEKQRTERLAEHLRRIEEIATDPAFESDAMGWIASECWKARTIECDVRHGRGWISNLDTGSCKSCKQCEGKGRL